MKAILIAEFGGACALCGYARTVRALEFHHLDPGSKRFGIGGGVARSIESLRAVARNASCCAQKTAMPKSRTVWSRCRYTLPSG